MILDYSSHRQTDRCACAAARGSDACSLGCRARYTNEELDWSSLEATTQSLADVIPFVVLVALSAYLGVVAWYYGRVHSMLVRGSCWNSYAWLALGTACMAAGRVVSWDYTLYTANAGERAGGELWRP